MQFAEVQRFRQKWIWLIIVIVAAFAAGDFINAIRDADKKSIIGTIVGLVLFIGIAYLIYFIRLTTRINEQGVYYTFPPFWNKERIILWLDVSQAYVRKYNPIMEYGGCGVRLGVFGRGKAYNVAGSMGLQIVFKNGKKLLLGTQKPEEMEAILQHLVRKKILTYEQIKSPDIPV
jgi:hypothetical protein